MLWLPFPLIVLLGLFQLAQAEHSAEVKMTRGKDGTYSIPLLIEGMPTPVMGMIDTGASYMAIPDAAIRHLVLSGKADLIKTTKVTYAAGLTGVQGLYDLRSIVIGGCQFKLVTTFDAEWPGRYVIGINVFNRVGGFTMDTTNNTLSFTCRGVKDEQQKGE